MTQRKCIICGESFFEQKCTKCGTIMFTASFCGTICAFKDWIQNNTNIKTMEELIQYVKELFQDELE